MDGFIRHLGVTHDNALDLIGRSVTIAKQARDRFLKDSPNKTPLIAGSVGPYGEQ